MTFAAVMFVLGGATGFCVERIWSDAVELYREYREELKR